MTILEAAAACIIPNVGGWAGSFFVAKSYDTFYKKLEKPPWNPPRWIFGPVWTTLYTGMGYASYIVWKETGGFTEKGTLPLALYSAQLALNWSWTPIFFGLHSISGGLVTISVLLATATASAVSFYRVSPLAGAIMAPYIGWLSFASVLNFSLYLRNPPLTPPSSPEKAN